MKMRTLLFGVILGLLAVAHSTPLNTVTQVPAKAEDEVFREAATDGFLVDTFLSKPTNTTVQDSKESGAIEGSGSEHSDKSTTSVSPQSGTTTASHDDSSSDPSATQSPQSSSTVTPDHISASQTTDPAVSTLDFLNTLGSESGSGHFPTTVSSSTTSSSNAETSTTSSTSTVALTGRKRPDVFATSEGSGSGEETTLLGEVEITAIKKTGRRMIVPEDDPLNQETKQVITPAPSKAGGTPGWMIIIGFIVGLAAMVMLFVAIATRDKWNGPRRASQGEDKSNSPNQTRELEMETFLRKDTPKENGHATEYTVIPLDELSENHSSH